MAVQPGVTRGNCLALLQQLPEKADLIVMDPPYNYGIDYESVDDSKPAGMYLAEAKLWLKACYDALAPRGSFWLIIADEWQPELTVAAKEIGFHWRNTVVWYYTFGVHTRYKFCRSHTMCIYFVKDRYRYTFNQRAVAVPSARQLEYNDKRAAAGGRTPDDLWVLRPKAMADAWGFDEDTWNVARVCGTHKERVPNARTQLPVALVERMVLSTSNVGQVVVDPMCGTGTTLVAAVRNRRKAYGFELGQETADLAQQRYLQAVAAVEGVADE